MRVLKVLAVALGALGTFGVVQPSSAQGIVFCAREGGYCRVPYPTTVIYGTGGATRAIDVSRGITCDNYTFGDPAPGARKSCSYVARGGRDYGDYREERRVPPRGYYDERPSRGWRTCAYEGGYCSFAGRRSVRYGVGGRFTERSLANGAPCNNRVFGDPAPGVSKVCQVLD